MTSRARLVSDASRHFAFGQNWKSYSTKIDEEKIDSAVKNLCRLLGKNSLSNLSFLDIGCGSGIHSLAALRLGARKVLALDIDPVSVDTCQQVLSHWTRAGEWKCEVASVFDLPVRSSETFDVVYSWGVLHHTGDMWRAIRAAAGKVRADGGVIALALYRKTPLCGLWRTEKRIYSRLPFALQAPILTIYSAANLGRLMLRGKNPVSHVRDYGRKRGMNFWHDEHDWLGGYPYESASPEDVELVMGKMGFTLVQSFVPKDSIGLTGASCAEYLFRRGPRPSTSQLPA
jgi:2-polyprenyl-3-methyl-5-hydroxy-6-metoxy-1,4-benzoquinol methylase